MQEEAEERRVIPTRSAAQSRVAPAAALLERAPCSAEEAAIRQLPAELTALAQVRRLAARPIVTRVDCAHANCDCVGGSTRAVTFEKGAAVQDVGDRGPAFAAAPAGGWGKACAPAVRLCRACDAASHDYGDATASVGAALLQIEAAVHEQLGDASGSESEEEEATDAPQGDADAMVRCEPARTRGPCACGAVACAVAARVQVP